MSQLDLPHALTTPFGKLRQRVQSWGGQGEPHLGWSLLVGLTLCVMALPVVTILVLAVTPADNIWPHLLRTVLPQSIYSTLLLMLGAGLLTLVVGTSTAWLVTMYRFPGRKIVDRLLVIPLAVPTYIVAYCYVEIFDYTGPIQSTLRNLFGWQSINDYWFPDVRSLAGATFIMSSVLYPYVYLAARATFIQQSVCSLEVARTLGRTPMGVFWSVALPLSRPALVAGVSLVLMECLNDLGAVEFLGVETLTASIYATWLQRSNLGGAAQIAATMLIFVIALVAIERAARGRAQHHNTTTKYRAIPFQDLDGWRGYLACTLCALPFICGFVLPFAVLLDHATTYWQDSFSSGFLSAAWNSLTLACLSAIFAVTVAIALSYARRVAANRFTRPAVRLAALGYAVPGTVLAIGLLIPLAALDNGLDDMMRNMFGISTGLLLSGSMIALVLAYVIRFLAVAFGNIEAGFGKISPNLDAAARALGESRFSSLLRVHLPLLLPAIGTAVLLVFVDSMKELPATLLMRPFNFETLATHVYSFASLDQFEEAALGALAIVLVGLIPVLLLHKTIAGGRAGH